MSIEEPLLNYEYSKQTFYCQSCMEHKPLSAIKEVNSKRLWCITCFDRMIENKSSSDGRKNQVRFAKGAAKREAYRNGARSSRFVAQK